MAESGMLELAQELLSSSKAEKIEWGAYGPDRFKVDIPNMTIMVSRLGREYSLRLDNSDGVLLDTLYSESPIGDPTHPILRELFELARKQTLNVDENINKALQFLKLDRSGAP